MPVDWSKVKIRCSSLGSLFTEPVTKEAKANGELSKTAKSHLIEVYAKEFWGVEKDIITKQMQKGKQAEGDGITLLSRVDKQLYQKNDEQKENEWICGHADIVEDDRITDTKISWDALTFLPKLLEPIDKDYMYQLIGYMWLWQKKQGRVSHLLVDTPENIIQGEKYRLLRSMDVVSEDSPEFLRAARVLESNMRFGHIPIEQRVINHYVSFDEEIIPKIEAKVAKAREFLAEFHEKHLCQNKMSES